MFTRGEISSFICIKYSILNMIMIARTDSKTLKASNGKSDKMNPELMTPLIRMYAISNHPQIC
jgi:hypothetical protein